MRALLTTILGAALALTLAACNMAAQVAPPTSTPGAAVATAAPADAPAATAAAEMPGSDATPAATPDAAAPLAGTEWRLATFGPPGGEAPPLDETEITLGFPDAETVRGSAGCNTYSGTYELGDGSLAFDAFAATEMACPNTAVMEQESAFLQALGAATSFTLEEGRLTLSGSDANLIFEAL